MKNISILFLATITLFSCNKDNIIVKEVNENIQIVEKSFIPDALYHYENLTQKTSGYLSVQSYRTLATKDNPESGSFKVGGIILDNSGDAQNFGTMTIGNLSMNANPNYGNTYGLREKIGMDLYGTNVSFSLNSILPTKEMYVPKIINITSHSQHNNPTINIDENIEWNTDNNNDLGVIITISYYPEENIELSNQHSEVIYHAVLTEDNGSYSFTNNDLSLFPPNANLSIKLIRGNYQIETTTDDRELTLWTYSMMEGIFQYQ